QYYDPETGLHYNYFRYYDPETARYLSADPIGLTPAPNNRAYVHNAATWADPLGLAPTDCEVNGKRKPEIITETYPHFEQARNKALEILGDIDPATRVPYVGRLESAATHGKVVGFETRVDGVWKQFRLDYDDVKGPHINVAVGKGASGQRWAIPWDGTEADMLKQLRGFEK
ncbi:RHS repeat-associated core domain-containing protein, partial [Streptomyces albus]|uniref:RHS repeat-associated core domain-containing protein n=2 Tax=Streptomyces TaxID=1883 RepID=UPI0027DEE7A8